MTYSGGLVNFDDSSNYTYDNNGNIINNGKYKFIYDYKNRIVEVTNEDNETIVSYEYDVLDRRYKKETPNKLVKYTFSNENVLEENITNSGISTITKEYINGLGIDDLIAYDLDSVRYYFNLNHLGSIDGISDNSGTTLISYEYDSYGNAFVNNSGSLIEISSYTGNTFENDRLYTGREFDREINLYYLRARYYDSKIGRFISRDSIDISDDINLYSYVGNNPVNYNDPSGELKQLLEGATLGDYNTNGNGWSVAGQIITGIVPYYGQAADVRDLSYQLQNGSYLDISLAGVGFVPGLGDGVKAFGKSGFAKKGFKTFQELKAYLGSAGFGNAWHHIVEQHKDNIVKFGAEKIHSVENVVSLPHLLPGSIHRKISGYYNSIREELDPTLTKTVREIVKNWDFDKQYNFGIDIIKKFGGNKYLK